MFQAEFDKLKNVLKISLAQRVDEPEARQCADRVAVLAANSPPGFRLLTDLTGLEEMALDCVPHIKRIMEVCNKAEVAMVVRVIPDPHKDIGFNILSVFHYRRRLQIVTCESLAEGVKILAKS